MTGFEYTRQWFDFAFENLGKVTPTHTALYCWLVELNNRLGWKKEFGAPASYCMEAIGIKAYNTFHKTFLDLVDWGFIKVVQKSTNQHSTNIIALLKFDKALDKALDKAITTHVIKQSESTCKSNCDIDKPINQETNKPTNQETALIIFDSFRKKYPGTKRGNKTEFENFSKKHKDWQEVLQLLETIIDTHIQSREVRKANKEFVPEWKNLQTWINNRCWEEEVKISKSRFEEVSSW